MRVDVRLIFHGRSAIKCFKTPVGCSFQETLLCGRLPISLRPMSHQLRGGLTPRGIRWLLTGYQFPVLTFFGVSHFSHFFRSSAQPLTLPSRWYAAMFSYYASAFFLILSLSLAYGKGLRHVSQYLVCSFVLGILVQIIHSATPVLFTCLRCILHVRLCYGTLCVTCSVVRVIEYFVLSAHIVSLKSCLCDGWGKYLCILYCHQGASRMRGNIAALALHTFYRATLSCLYKTFVSW